MKTEILKINSKDYSLNPRQLDLLMEEFYGKQLESGVKDEFLEYIFTNDTFDSLELYTSAVTALEIFKIRKIEK